jgi:hypothetical protein
VPHPATSPTTATSAPAAAASVGHPDFRLVVILTKFLAAVVAASLQDSSTSSDITG